MKSKIHFLPTQRVRRQNILLLRVMSSIHLFQFAQFYFLTVLHVLKYGFIVGATYHACKVDHVNQNPKNTTPMKNFKNLMKAGAKSGAICAVWPLSAPYFSVKHTVLTVKDVLKSDENADK